MDIVPYWAKHFQAKFSSGVNIRRAKFSSPNEKFVTFAWRKIPPNKSISVFKWITSEPTRETSHSDKFWLSCWAKLFRAKFSPGETIRQVRFSSLSKIRHFCSTKFRPINNQFFQNSGNREENGQLFKVTSKFHFTYFEVLKCIFLQNFANGYWFVTKSKHFWFYRNFCTIFGESQNDFKRESRDLLLILILLKIICKLDSLTAFLCNPNRIEKHFWVGEITLSLTKYG